MAELTQILDSPQFKAFASYTTIVLLKMLLMGPLTSYFRLTRKVFCNPEDVSSTLGLSGKSKEEKKKYIRTDPDVERVRRCHQNDLENIVPFVGIGLLYTLTGPDLGMALLHFRIFVISRCFHTVAYLVPLPQPSRALSWMAGLGVSVSMAYHILSKGCIL
ncbi:microsomal glutathione S-transferase 1.1 [Polypterus senegalus]|uniref:microsomal glutathione S-transferase 1.1 n=1 Tax=Polypterus senegalus TaxID=55291 RepID=UPI001964D40E|nr:microsomal glutathione S-transferase 1.1 [Polypterus senegalus]XP_039625362.1 microsomal glutathione S-transferase 1.1 [Polypterus senegalus]XP_039625363.1 microsomal glutathione S-transferase 1.1 [Polypterus senegalus]